MLAIDYRGFGHSTGKPTEDGLVLDASAAVDWALHVAGVPADRIVLLGQSLGTAVTAAVAERYAAQGVDFAGVVLVSGFSSLPAMLSDYAIAGFVPILRPLKIWPWLLRFVLEFMVDEWRSADRLGEMVRTVKARGGRLRLSLIHAKDDWDIPCHEDNKLFAGAVSGTVDDPAGIDPEALEEEKDRRTVDRGKHEFVTTWTDGGVEIRQELFPYGGESNMLARWPTDGHRTLTDIVRAQRHHDVRPGNNGCY